MSMFLALAFSCNFLILNCVNADTEYALASQHETDDIAESSPLERKMFAEETGRFNDTVNCSQLQESCVFILSVAFHFNQNKEK